MLMAHKLKFSECGYQATQKSSLHTLKSMHIGQQFQCPECEHQGSYKSDVVRNQEFAHIGHKFQCQECNHQFSYKSDLTKHHESVHRPTIGMSRVKTSAQF